MWLWPEDCGFYNVRKHSQVHLHVSLFHRQLHDLRSFILGQGISRSLGPRMMADDRRTSGVTTTPFDKKQRAGRFLTWEIHSTQFLRELIHYTEHDKKCQAPLLGRRSSQCILIHTARLVDASGRAVKASSSLRPSSRTLSFSCTSLRFLMVQSSSDPRLSICSSSRSQTTSGENLGNHSLASPAVFFMNDATLEEPLSCCNKLKNIIWQAPY